MEARSALMVTAGFVAGVGVTLIYVSFMEPSSAVAPTAAPPVATANAPTALPAAGPTVAAAESLKVAVAKATLAKAAAAKDSTERATRAATPSGTRPIAATAPKTTSTPPRRDAVSNIDGAGAMQLIIPVMGINAAQLRDTYSDARGSGRRHDAIDIMAPHNTPVIAAAPAVVVKRDHGARGGIALYALAADRSTIYYYAHLDRYAPGVVEGTTLRAGDVLGYVGDTGNAGAGNYHLHFEITTTSDPKRYWGGASHNPYPLLRKGITVRQ